MHHPTHSDSRSFPPLGGVVTRALPGPRNDTAQPSLTSGFGAVIEKEEDLQTATEVSLGQASGDQAIAIDRILRQQHSRLGANIALLEQRYETLPRAERFVNWQGRHRPPVTPRHVGGDESTLLADLIALHTNLLANIEALIGCAPDGQRGELILTEVRRNHEEMSRMLTALLKEDGTSRRMPDEKAAAAPGSTSRAEERWDNEGGQVRSADAPAADRAG